MLSSTRDRLHWFQDRAGLRMWDRTDFVVAVVDTEFELRDWPGRRPPESDGPRTDGSKRDVGGVGDHCNRKAFLYLFFEVEAFEHVTTSEG